MSRKNCYDLISNHNRDTCLEKKDNTRHCKNLQKEKSGKSIHDTHQAAGSSVSPNLMNKLNVLSFFDKLLAVLTV